MKRNFIKIGLVFTLALVSTMTLTSCGSEAADAAKTEEEGPKSVKGKWLDAEKEQAQAEVDKVRGQVEELLGENTDAYIECYLEKVEDAYPDFQTANSDQPGCTKLAQECMEGLMIAPADTEMETE